jgi:hypothetical protein
MDKPELGDAFDGVRLDTSPEQSGGPPPAAQALTYEEPIASPRFGNDAAGSGRLQSLIAICGLLGTPLTRADGREKQKVIDGLESHRDSLLVRCSQSTQQTEEIQGLVVEQTISALLARNRGVQGVGTAIRARLVMANGNHAFPTEGGVGLG